MIPFDRSSSRRPTPVLDTLLGLIEASRPPGVDRRVWQRVRIVTVGSLIALGRHTLSQVVIALGVSGQDWTAWYRLFNRRRLALDRGRQVVLGQLLARLGATDPLVVVVDATQLPRSSRRFPGVGAIRAPRTPVWRPGVHLAQRVELVSGLLPRTADGTSRAVPVRSTVLRTERTAPMGTIPIQTECQAAGQLLTDLRADLAALGDATRPVLVLGDGAYGNAPMLTALPAGMTLVARCTCNRALWALPIHLPGQRGRRRRYGDRGLTPQEHLTEPGASWQRPALRVRGRIVTPKVRVTGPWLVRPLPDTPLFLIVVGGVDRGKGLTRKQRDPHYFLVSAARDAAGTPVLPYPVAELLAWCWQRWEVEVMHRELKSSCGLGDQQAWSPDGATLTLEWALWTYALLILSGATVWGLGPPPGPRLSGWFAPRRWSVGRLLQEIRAECWHLAPLRPGRRRFPDDWTEMEGWSTTQTTAALGIRHI